MLHLLHGPDHASRTSLVPPKQHLGCAKVEVTLGADRIGPGYPGVTPGFARVTPGSRQRLHPCCTRVAPCLCPATPRSPPSHTRATPGDALVTSRSHPGYTQPMLGPCPRHCMSWTSCPRVTPALQPRPPKLHQGYSKVVPIHTKLHPGYTRLHRGNAKVTHRIRPGGTPVTPWIYLGHTLGYTPVAPG
jgi:hypothetical protein